MTASSLWLPSTGCRVALLTLAALAATLIGFITYHHTEQRNDVLTLSADTSSLHSLATLTVSSAFHRPHNNSLAVAILAHQPTATWWKFAQQAAVRSPYDVYLVIDDSSAVPADAEVKYPDVRTVTYSERECYARGYTQASFSAAHNWGRLVSSWDKALLFFAVEPVGQQYDFVWMIEDDTYIADAALNVLTQHVYKQSNVPYDLVGSWLAAHADEPSWGHWPLLNVAQPWYHGVMAVCGVSRRLLQAVAERAAAHGHLYYIEAMLPTLAMQNHLHTSAPEILHHIYVPGYELHDDDNDAVQQEIRSMGIDAIYHPVKDQAMHDTYRGTVRGD